MSDLRDNGINIWFVAMYFPPINVIGAERAKKFFRHFVNTGHSVTVFTLDILNRKDHNFVEAFEDDKCRRSEVLFPTFHVSGSSNSRKPAFWRRNFPRIVTVLFDDSGWTWMRGLRRDLGRAMKESGPPDIIVATGRPFLTFLTVSRFCRRNGIPYILDYRDAWSGNPHSMYDNFLRRRLLRWLEAKVNRNADAVLTVSHLTAEALVETKPPLVLYNFPDVGYVNQLREVVKLEQHPEDTRLTLSFSGTLYPGRSLAPVCAALTQLTPEERNQIALHYCGTSGARAEADFATHKITDQLVNHGPLYKSAAIQLVADCDIALSVISSEEDTSNDALRGVITTKIFDYIILEKPILNIVPPDFEFTEMARDLGLTGIHDIAPCNEDAVADLLRHWLKAKASGQLGRAADCESHVNDLVAAWEMQMEKLNELIAKITAK